MGDTLISSTDTEMRAVRIENASAPPHVVSLPRPVPQGDEVLVRVEAVGLNPFDLMRARGGGGPFGLKFPAVPGSEGVGEVVGGTGDLVGQHVWFAYGASSLAEYVVLDPTRSLVRPYPASVEPGLASALGIAGTTAWAALAATANLQHGERVLVLGVGGGVASVAVAVAKSLGASFIAAVSRDEASVAQALANGADVAFTWNDETTAHQLASLDPAGFDVVLDPFGGAPLAAAVGAAAPGARIILLGSTAEPSTPILAAVSNKALRLIGHSGSSIAPADHARAYSSLLQLAEHGTIALDLRRFTLEQITDAWESLGRRSGPKIVIDLV